MKIHEYQAKQMFARYGVPIPRGYPRADIDEAEAAATQLAQETGSPVVVVKAQIHAGGRGKGGGVKVVKREGAERGARSWREKMLGMQLVTHQTGPEGQKVRRLYVEQGLDIARELYLGAVIDRDRRRIAFMASTEGGVEIEKVAAETPEKILTVHVDPAVGFAAYQARELAFAPRARRQGRRCRKFVKLLASLYEVVTREDCSLCEINPLVVTKTGDVVALDAKVDLRRQRRVPPPRVEGPRGQGRGGPRRARGQGRGPELRLARRQRRVPRQRRRPGDGDDGHHQALRREAAASPRRTSSTSAAAPTRSRSPRPSRSS